MSALNSLKKKVSFVLRVTDVFTPTLTLLPLVVCPSLFHKQRFGREWGLDSESLSSRRRDW